jgi:hypothetical protein
MPPGESVDHGRKQTGCHAFRTADAKLPDSRIGKELEFLKTLCHLVESSCRA